MPEGTLQFRVRPEPQSRYQSGENVIVDTNDKKKSKEERMALLEQAFNESYRKDVQELQEAKRKRAKHQHDKFKPLYNKEPFV